MPHAMRRKDRALPEAEAWEILCTAHHGVLATVDLGGQPYAVPVNHVLVGRRLYLHCALEGHKLENLAQNPRISYCVVSHAEVEPAEFSTAYESVIAFGVAVRVDSEDEKCAALRALNAKFAPGFESQGESMLETHLDVTEVVAVTVSHVTGKRRPGASRPAPG